MSKSGLQSKSLRNLSLPHKNLSITTPPSSPLTTKELDNNIIDLDQASPLAANSYEQLYRDAFDFHTIGHSNTSAVKPSTRSNQKNTTNKKTRFGSVNNKVAKKTQGQTSTGRENDSYLASYLLTQTKGMLSSGENPNKALELGIRAMKAFESSRFKKPSLEYIMCLHIVAALHCSLGEYNEAIPVLERAIEIAGVGETRKHLLAKFSGCMQLGDTYAMLGFIENSILCYKAGLGVQKHALGGTDPRFGETCRYVAEAHIQALEFDEAKKLCQMALDIHKSNGSTASVEAAADHWLMGLACDANCEYEAALEHYMLARVNMAAAGQSYDVAAVDICIGETYLSLSRYNEAVSTFEKALNAFKNTKGDNHPSVASVFVRLAELCYKMGRFTESKSYCLNTLRIYENPTSGSLKDDIGNGFIEVAGIYELMSDLSSSIKLLKRALKVLGQDESQLSTIAGVEAQMGVLYYTIGSYENSYRYLKGAVTKLRAVSEKKSGLFGIVLNQMGVVCVQLGMLQEAADVFEEAKGVMEVEYGDFDANTVAVCSNIAGTYDAMGRWEDAIEMLEYVVRLREGKLGTASADVDDERLRLRQLLKDAGKERRSKSLSLQFLLVG
ncbi:protein KINESIN LIGHT CHAIN-RELATED 2-like [Bidens hawaiensis]|uniref:protein KINESIN LIGHT CHAIN-RELATED 2-like n=1 Tax=Bidens hawaiensis TaxID=980011 RepID=UPI00404B40B5